MMRTDPERSATLWQGDSVASRVLLTYWRSTPRFPGKGRIFNWLVANAFGGRLPVRNQHGARLTIDPTDYTGYMISVEGVFESHSIALAQEIMRDGGVFVDVGCNLGVYTLSVGVLPGVQCIAIDASFLALTKLKANLARNPGINATLVNCALASGNTLQCFEVADPENLGSTKVADNEQKADSSRFWVASLPLQHVLERLCPNAIKLLKIDVEGSEMSVFKGLDFDGPFRPQNLIVECFAELFPQATQYVDFLAARGYEAMTIEGVPVTHCDDLPEKNVWFRCTRRH